MFKYNTILEIASEIAENDLIPKDGLTVIYELDEENHKKLDESLFFKINKGKPHIEFEHTDVIEVKIAGILFKFIQKKI